MAIAVNQRDWRNNGVTVASICAHLGPKECAVLDAIAIELYEQNPHDPRRGVFAEVFPGRAEAIRFICRQYRDAGNRGETWLRKLQRMRSTLSEFWVREARRARSKHKGGAGLASGGVQWLFAY